MTRSGALSVLLLLACCAAPIRWQRMELGDGDLEQVWTTFADVCHRTGHPAGNQTDRGLRIFVSRWRERPLPFGKGRRTRVHGEFERDEATRAWRLRYRVEAQRVRDFARALEPGPDDWVADGQDGQLEELIGAQLHSHLRLPRSAGQ